MTNELGEPERWMISNEGRGAFQNGKSVRVEKQQLRFAAEKQDDGVVVATQLPETHQENR
jgi:hypothetical protein